MLNVKLVVYHVTSRLYKVKGIGREVVEWIDLAHIMGKWPDLVNVVFGSIKRREFFFLTG